MSEISTTSSPTASCLPSFSHLYIEKAAQSLPGTDRLKSRFRKTRVVEIEDYKEVFNRGYQHWRLQKRSPKLIIARRREDFLYPCSDIAPSFGHQHFFYNTVMLNCIYDCDYCYLQGTYPSANLVMFVNDHDYFEATDRVLKDHPLYLCLSYDTDLLALEAVYPYSRNWIEFTRQRPDLLVEIRTKSANYRLIADLPPCPNVVLAWTLSPDPIAKRFEPLTPALEQRLASLGKAIEDGWPVRLCLDPLLRVKRWPQVYRDFLAELDRKLPWSRLRDASVGVFRMNKDFLKRIRRQRKDSPLIHYPYQVEEKVASYPGQQRQEMIELVAGHLRSRMGDQKVVVV